MGTAPRSKRRLAGRYRLERRIGRGGRAEVWQAHDERLDRTVALKLLKPGTLPDEASRRRFVAEARAASGLTHPGIVPAYDVLDDPASPAIVFQHVDGEPLAQRMRRGPVPTGEAIHIAAQVAAALEHAHRAGVVHRDVKPANILIDADGRARLVDFGIAQVARAGGNQAARNDEVAGTLRYMAPEQLAGGSTDARTDLYALGLVLAELLPDLASVPDWLRELMERLRATDPADRPRSAGDIARALETGPLDDPNDPPIDEHDEHDEDAEDAEETGPPTVAFALPAAGRRAAIRATAGEAAGTAVPVPVPGPSRRTPDIRPIAVAAVLVAALVGGIALAGRPPGFVPAGGGPGSTLPAGLSVPPTTAPAPVVERAGKGPGHGHDRH